MRRNLELILLAAVMAGTGCRREQIRELDHSPKDAPPQERVAHGPNDGHNHGDEEGVAARPKPKVSWKLPQGWAEASAGQMSLANFTIKGAGTQEAQVTVTPLGRLAGRESVVINMFRQQLGLEPLGPEEVAKELQDVTVGSEKGKLFELAGKAGGNEPQTLIVTAMAHRSDATWFYKLAGDRALVEAQKPAFLEFLKSIQIEESAVMETPPQEDTAAAGKFKWQVPADWKQVTAGQMQLARFSMPGKDGAKAEVFVSAFPNDTGGMAANINRWRRQIQLTDIDAAAIPAAVKPVEALPGAVFTELSNNANGQQLIGAIVPRGGEWWFYKLMGAAEVVGPQRENFLRFIQSTP